MHTKNLPVAIIAHCPLSSKFTFSKSTPYIRRCLKIIESARIVWGYYSDEYKSCCYEIVDGEEVPKKFPPYSTLKLTSARSIQSWYTERSDLILTSQKTSEAIKKAVSDVRRYARRGIEKEITDKEILAIFAICEAFDAVYKIQREETEDAIKEKVLTASTFLKLAKTGLEPEKKDTPVSTPQKQGKTKDVIHFPTPSGAKWSDLKMTIIDYDKTVKIEVKGGKTITTNYKEMGFEDGRKRKPNDAWKRLIIFADKKGMLPKFSSTEKDKIEKDIQEIRNTLSVCFKINGKPIPDYIKEEGYKTAFEISYREARESTPKEFSNFEDNKDNIDS